MTTTTHIPKTPAQKHAQARQAQAMSRLGGVLILLVFLGIPVVFVGLLLYSLVRKSRRRLAILAPAMLIGLVVVGFGYRTVIAEAKVIQQLAAPYQPALRDLVRKPNKQHIAPRVGHLWLIALPLAPLVALYLESTRTKSVNEQREEKQRKEQAQEREQRRLAAQKVKRAPDEVGGLAVIGVPFGGDLDWTAKGWAVYTPQMLNRHAVIIGGSGTGKTEFILRVAYLARKVFQWKVFYLDAKGDAEVANRFMAAMAHTGVSRVEMFPNLAYNGWIGDAPTILNRLMAVEDYSEPYYRAVAKTVLSLAVNALSGPPRSSIDLLGRLKLSALAEFYRHENSIRADALMSLTEESVNGVQRRYFGFFDSLGQKLDGAWSFDTVDAGYILLDGLALKEDARSLGRYILEDFAHYVAKRKKADEKVLLIVDEFSAISESGADAANLFERVRSYGAGIMVTSQTNEGLGEDAKKLIGAAAVTIAFQCADPEPIAERAGKMKEVHSALAVEYAAIPGRNPLMSGKEHLSGTNVQREQEVLKLHPDTIRRLNIGECCIISNGAYQEVKVARVPEHAAGAQDTRRLANSQPGPAIEITPPRALPVTEIIGQGASEPPAGDDQRLEDHAIQDSQATVRADSAALPSQKPELAREDALAPPANSPSSAAPGTTTHLRDQEDSQAELDL